MLGAPVIIHDDHGGIIEQYQAREQAWEYAGKRIIIDGRCASACTLYLHSPYTCATSRASFWFHAARDAVAYRGRVIIGPIDRSESNMMIGYYPPRIAGWVQQHGGLGPHLIVLRGREMRGLVPQCRNGGDE